MARWLVVFGTLLLTATCGYGPASPLVESSPSRSLAVLSAPPDVASFGEFGGVTYCTSGDTPVVTFISDPNAEITVPGVRVLAIGSMESGGQAYFIAASVSASDSLLLYRYHDTSGDGTPDAATEELLVDSGANKIFAITVVARTPSEMFVLDARCQDVLRLVDTNNDGWVDGVHETAFALSSTYPDLLTSQWLLAIDGDGNFALLTSDVPEPLSFGALTGHGHRVLWLVDDNDDGQADRLAIRETLEVSPRFAGPRPSSGDTQVGVASSYAGTSKTAEVWELDSAREPIALLGSASLGGATSVDVTLSRALIAGEFIGVWYSTDEAYVSVLTVDVARAAPSR